MRMLSMPLLAALMSAGSVCAQTAQNTTSSYLYDAEGNLTEVSDGLRQVTKFGYDPLARRIRVSPPNNGTETATTYGFDLRDQNTLVRDPRNLETSYVIDGLGNLTRTTSSDTGVTTDGYDEAGNLTSRTDAKLQTTTFKYDAIDRLTFVTYHDGSTVAYQYDQDHNAIGRLSKIVEAATIIEYQYDTAGRLISDKRTIGGKPYVVGYVYDDTGRLSGMRYPSGRAVNYGFDRQGRVNKITTQLDTVNTSILNNVSYQPFGPVKTITFGNNRTHTRTYDLDGRVATYSLASQTMKLGYDAASRVTSIADTLNSASGTTYGYDVMGRLTSVVTQSASQTYEYDAVGNRRLKMNNGNPTTYTYSATSNRLTQIGPLPLSTDPNGSMTVRPNATFNYDARGRMISANTQVGLVSYTINSLGQRIRKVTPTSETVYHYDTDGKLIAESTTAAGSTKTQEYIYLGEMPVAVMK